MTSLECGDAGWYRALVLLGSFGRGRLPAPRGGRCGGRCQSCGLMIRLLGRLLDILWLDEGGERGGSFYSQPASMPTFQQNFTSFLRRSQIFLYDSAEYEEGWQLSAICRNSSKILWKSRRKMTDLSENSILQKSNNPFDQKIVFCNYPRIIFSTSLN